MGGTSKTAASAKMPTTSALSAENWVGNTLESSPMTGKKVSRAIPETQSESPPSQEINVMDSLKSGKTAESKHIYFWPRRSLLASERPERTARVQSGTANAMPPAMETNETADMNTIQSAPDMDAITAKSGQHI